MLIKFDLESDLFKHIEELIRDGKYEDILQFIRIAISNQLQEEKAGIQSKQIRKQAYDSIKKSSIGFEQQPEVFLNLSHQLTQSLSKWKELESDFDIGESSLIWSFYNRFFPLKIIVIQLAKLISPEKPWVDIEELKETAVLMAQDRCRILKEYESDKQVSRNKRLSIGLPLHPIELEGLRRKKDIRDMEERITSSKRRFMRQFIGRYYESKNDEYFSGACFDLGLMSVKLSGNKCLVSLTDLGKEFAILDNPIFHEVDFDKAFSDQEMKLIYEKVIPQFKIEKKIVDNVIELLKTKSSFYPKKIEPVFRKYENEILTFYYRKKSDGSFVKPLTQKKKDDTIIAARVSTMGRLAEIGIVDWKVDSSGKSHYSLNKEKAAFLGLN